MKYTRVFYVLVSSNYMKVWDWHITDQVANLQIGLVWLGIRFQDPTFHAYRIPATRGLSSRCWKKCIAKSLHQSIIALQSSIICCSGVSYYKEAGYIEKSVVSVVVLWRGNQLHQRICGVVMMGKYLVNLGCLRLIMLCGYEIIISQNLVNGGQVYSVMVS